MKKYKKEGKKEDYPQARHILKEIELDENIRKEKTRFGIALFFSIFFILFGITLILTKYYPALDIFGLTEEQFKVIGKITLTLAIISITQLIISKVILKVEKSTYEGKVKEEKVFFTKSLVRVVLWIIAILIILTLFLKNWSSLLTALGLVGAGLAIALQHPILNLIGWLVIIINKPLSVGERIQVSNLKGDVFDINIMYTKIRLLDEMDSPTGKFVTIPNELILTSPVINFTRGTPYIWDTLIFSITYESDLKKAKQIILDTATKYLEHKKIIEKIGKRKRRFTDEKIQEKPLLLMELKDSSVNFKLRYLVNTKEKNVVRTELNEKIYEKIKKAKDVEIAYPHVHVVGIK